MRLYDNKANNVFTYSSVPLVSFSFVSVFLADRSYRI